VDFPAPFLFDADQMVTRTENVVNIPKSEIVFLNALEWKVWLGIWSVLLLVTIAGALDRDEYIRLQNRSDELRGKGNRLQQVLFFLLKHPVLALIRKSFYASLMTQVGQASTAELHSMQRNGKGSTSRQRFVTIIAVMCGVFFIIVFGASVTSQLFNTRQVSQFESVEDLQSCKIPADKVCFQGAGGEERFWNSAVNTSEYVRYSNKRMCRLLFLSECDFRFPRSPVLSHFRYCVCVLIA
jgi:hypothetical protein